MAEARTNNSQSRLLLCEAPVHGPSHNRHPNGETKVEIPLWCVGGAACAWWTTPTQTVGFSALSLIPSGGRLPKARRGHFFIAQFIITCLSYPTLSSSCIVHKYTLPRQADRLHKSHSFTPPPDHQRTHQRTPQDSDLALAGDVFGCAVAPLVQHAERAVEVAACAGDVGQVDRDVRRAPVRHELKAA